MENFSCKWLSDASDVLSKKALSNYDWRPDSSASRALEQYSESPGPSCSKPTMSLVNDLLKF